LKTYAAAVGAKIYFFGEYYYRGENHTSVGPLDVQVFETGTTKYYSELKIGIVYH